MARPRNADAADTRRRILDAAIQRFGAHGLKGASLRTIATDAGVTFATVHHYFGCKSDLFDRCLEAGYARLGDLRSDLGEALGGDDRSATVRVRALAEAAYDFALTHSVVSRFLLRATLYEDQAGAPGQTQAAQRLYLDIASSVLAPIVSRDAAELRIPLQGLMVLLTRVAIMSDAELENVGPTQDPDATQAQMRAYLGDVAIATLLAD